MNMQFHYSFPFIFSFHVYSFAGYFVPFKLSFCLFGVQTLNPPGRSAFVFSFVFAIVFLQFWSMVEAIFLWNLCCWCRFQQIVCSDMFIMAVSILHTILGYYMKIQFYVDIPIYLWFRPFLIELSGPAMPFKCMMAKEKLLGWYVCVCRHADTHIPTMQWRHKYFACERYVLLQ